MLSIRRCDKCGEKADALDGNQAYCTKHWFEIYGGKHGKSKIMAYGHGRGRGGYVDGGLRSEAWQKPDGYLGSGSQRNGGRR